MLQDLPKPFQTFKTFSHSRQILPTSELPGIPPYYSILWLECIFYTSAGFHRKLHWVPVELLGNFNFFKEREMLQYRLFPIALTSSMCWQQFTVSPASSEWLKDKVSMNSPVETSLSSYVWSVLRTLEWLSQVSNLWAIKIPAKSNCHLFL